MSSLIDSNFINNLFMNSFTSFIGNDVKGNIGNFFKTSELEYLMTYDNHLFEVHVW
jgi:hypothetical protein